MVRGNGYDVGESLNDREERRRAVLVLITEDWFAVSHFLPLLRALVDLDISVTVATRCAGKQHLIEATGARVVPFDFKRGSIDPLRDAGVVVRLRRLIRQVAPDAIHAIAMKPITLGALAAAAGLRVPTVIHLTGVGLAGVAPGIATRAMYASILGTIRMRLRSPQVRVLLENPDDKARLVSDGTAEAERITLLGGAGIDPARLEPLPPPPEPVRIGYVGRMVWSKGVDVLVEAHRLLRAEGREVELLLCGAPDPENPRAIDSAMLEGWARLPGVEWTGFEPDVRKTWTRAHIAAVPSRGGEGLPKALLEAAACARPLVASDVPGCRHFVREGIEGHLVPAESPMALASALRRLVDDAEARSRMGAAARSRVLSAFTERHVEDAVQRVYRELLDLSAPSARLGLPHRS